jgi:hypothetical protein
MVTEHEPSLPSGPLDPIVDHTLDRALRRWVLSQAGMSLGYVEQLYTFGDKNRDPRSRIDGVRALSIAYLALVREERPSAGAAWIDWYDLLPWEDHRDGSPDMIKSEVAPALVSWGGATQDAVESALRVERIQIAFGLDGAPWDPVRVLERYELMYEVGLIAEAHRDGAVEPGIRAIESTTMGLDHRRIVATALERLRGKLCYRPVIFELLAETFRHSPEHVCTLRTFGASSNGVASSKEQGSRSRPADARRSCLRSVARSSPNARDSA